MDHIKNFVAVLDEDFLLYLNKPWMMSMLSAILIAVYLASLQGALLALHHPFAAMNWLETQGFAVSCPVTLHFRGSFVVAISIYLLSAKTTTCPLYSALPLMAGITQIILLDARKWVFTKLFWVKLWMMAECGRAL